MPLVNPWKLFSKYKAGTNYLIIFFVYHATGKTMKISMYKAGANLLIIFYFHHATDKSMEISMYKAGTLTY